MVIQCRMDTTLPSLFVSHGSPMIALEPGAAGAFMQRLGPAIDAAFGRPKAIVTVSAHTTARIPIVLGAARHQAIYDFGGFDPRLRQMRYDALGDPALAARILALLRRAGIAAEKVDEGGLDHGAWTALRFIYPTADVPVVPLAFVANDPPARQFALGEALRPLADEGVLVLGSGSITHNLPRIFAMLKRPPGEQTEDPQDVVFRDWLAERGAALEWDDLFAYRSRAPNAIDAHPTDEHLLPWYVAAGAGGQAVAPMRLLANGLDAYAFGASAARIADALNRQPEPAH